MGSLSSTGGGGSGTGPESGIASDAPAGEPCASAARNGDTSSDGDGGDIDGVGGGCALSSTAFFSGRVSCASTVMGTLGSRPGGGAITSGASGTSGVGGGGSAIGFESSGGRSLVGVGALGATAESAARGPVGSFRIAGREPVLLLRASTDGVAGRAPSNDGDGEGDGDDADDGVAGRGPVAARAAASCASVSGDTTARAPVARSAGLGTGFCGSAGPRACASAGANSGTSSTGSHTKNPGRHACASLPR